MPVKTTPPIVEIPPLREAALDRVAYDVIQSGAAPAAACAAGVRVEGAWHWGMGAAGTLWPVADTPAAPHTVFDLASLTKPVFAIAAASESMGLLDWLAPLSAHLPELSGTWAASATFEQLLSHRAGLQPHLELFQALRTGHSVHLLELMRAAANAQVDRGRAPTATPQAHYSDLGYLLAGAAIERLAAKPLDRWLGESPPAIANHDLGSVRHWLQHDKAFRLRCAPTELVPWRRGLVWCRVHDENAWTFAGHGLCGHAGLFGTAIGVGRFGAAVLDALAGRPSVIPHYAACLTTKPREGGSLSAGFDLKSEACSTAGESASANAFGHLGFTGTSLWCDPNRSMVAVVLTNRVCPTRHNLRIRAMRADLHDRLFAWGVATRANRPA